jgi:polyphosphate kinase 2 (PPK2 family)
MIIDPKDYRVPPGKKVDLGKWPTIVDPYSKSTKQYKQLLQQHIEKLSSQQQLHYASHRYALLLIFQGVDGAGKDGAIRHVMSGVNPEGCEVFSFKQPSAEELDHDFLWRTTCRLPERGRIGIFNRSYYEEVLVVRVHPELLRSQGLPEELRDEKDKRQARIMRRGTSYPPTTRRMHGSSSPKLSSMRLEDSRWPIPGPRQSAASSCTRSRSG